jgi:hypothetical protein
MLNKNGKDIVCVGAYCDNEKKINMVEKLLIFLNENKERLNFDILLVSRTHVPKKIQEYVDFLIFDKSNHLLKYDGYSPANTVFDNYHGCVVYSSFENTNTTIIPATYNFIHGLNYSKYMGYDSMHYMEYDKIPCEKLLNEIDDNSKILKNDNIDYVLYYNDIDSINGSMHSTSLRQSKVELFNVYNPEKLIEIANERLLQVGLSASSEKIFLGLIKDSGCNIFYKNFDILKTFTDLITHKSKIMVSFYYDENYENYGCFIANISDEDLTSLSLELLYKNEKILIIDNFDLKSLCWMDQNNVIKNIEIGDDSTIVCNINGKLYANYTFDTYKKYEFFFKTNKKVVT